MRLATSSLLLAVGLLAAPAARAQSLVSEAVRGNHRLCNYGGDNGLLSGTLTGGQYEVGIAENCPLTLPVANDSRPAPPTAALRSDTPATDGRVCVYEQWGSRWTFNLRDRPACPATAGMIPRDWRMPMNPGRLPTP